MRVNGFNFCFWHFRFLNLSKPETADFVFSRLFPPHEIFTVDRKFDNESFGGSLVLEHPGALFQNSCLLFLGWKGLISKIKIMKFEIGSKSYIRLPTLFFETQVSKFLRLLCLLIVN